MQGEARPRLALARRAAPFVSALLVSLAFAGQAQAAPGGLDRSFGEAGIAPANLGPSYRETAFSEIEPQDDGSLLATRDGWVRRYGADGRLDAGFSPQPAPPPSVRAVQDDGKVLTVDSAGSESRLVRSNPDGSPDSTFSGAAVPISIAEILPLPGGGILVAGTTFFAYVTRASSIQQIGLARFEANGALDTSFGNGGIVKLRSDYGIEPGALSGIAARPGEASTVLASSALVGLTATGRVDSAYGNGGTVEIPGSPVDFHPVADDKLLVLEAPPLGCCESGDFVLARYTSTGALDPAYGGGDGLVGPVFGGVDRATGVRWEEDGSVLVGGSLVIPPAGSVGCPYPLACFEMPTLARFTPDGQPDPGLGGGGRIELGPLAAVVARLGIDMAGVRTIAPRPGGGLYVGGGSGPGTSVAFLAALSVGGGLDASFGEGGIVRERTSQPSWSNAADVAIAGEGGILVGGETNAGAGEGLLAVARYEADGALDRDFGSGAGFVRIPRPLGSDWHLNALAVDRDGRPVVLTGKQSVVRLKPGGALDGTFGKDGSVEPNSRDELHALVVLRDGRILVAGSVITGKHSTRMAVFRLLPDGRLDPRFGHRGMATVSFGRQGHAAVRRLTIQPDGRILLAGYVRDSMALARLLPDGSLDRGFGHRGRIVPPVERRSKGTAVAVQGGKVLLAGWLQRAGKTRALLLRYTRKGQLDRSFARRGISSAFPVALGKKRDVLPEPVRILPTRRRIVVIRAGRGRPVLAYRRDGRLDRFFGHSRAIAPHRLSGPVGAMQRGKVVLAWNTKDALARTFALQRLRTR